MTKPEAMKIYYYYVNSLHHSYFYNEAKKSLRETWFHIFNMQTRQQQRLYITSKQWQSIWHQHPTNEWLQNTAGFLIHSNLTIKFKRRYLKNDNEKRPDRVNQQKYYANGIRHTICSSEWVSETTRRTNMFL